MVKADNDVFRRDEKENAKKKKLSKIQKLLKKKAEERKAKRM